MEKEAAVVSLSAKQLLSCTTFGRPAWSCRPFAECGSSSLALTVNKSHLC